MKALIPVASGILCNGANSPKSKICWSFFWSIRAESLKISPPLTTLWPTPANSFKSLTTLNFFKSSINNLTAAAWLGIAVFLMYSLPLLSLILNTAFSIPTRSAIPEAITLSSGKENNLYLKDELPELIAKTFFIT